MTRASPRPAAEYTCPCGCAVERTPSRVVGMVYCSRQCAAEDGRARNLSRLSETQESRFWARVSYGGPNKCWLWLGWKDDDGYGQVRFAGRLQQAHRVAWQLTRGDLGSSLCMHTCDNPPCCNPSHLVAGTQVENMDDMKMKGRASRLQGERNPNSRLTEGDVLAIRQRHADGEHYASIAQKYGMDRKNIHRIISGRAWSTVRMVRTPGS